MTLKELKNILEKEFGWNNIYNKEYSWFVDNLLKDSIKAMQKYALERYHTEELLLPNVVKQSEQFNCYEMHTYSRFDGCNKQCKECADNEKSKAI